MPTCCGAARRSQGKVVSKEPRLQVELAPGIVGTVRESDANPADYEIGEAIEVLVRSADRATRRINLTTMHGAPKPRRRPPNRRAVSHRWAKSCASARTSGYAALVGDIEEVRESDQL